MPLPQLARFLSSPWRLVRLATMLGAGIAATWGLVRQGPILLRSDPPDLVSPSPDGRWSLEVHALAGWLYGPHDVRVLARRLDGRWWNRLPGQFRALEFQLRNDGAVMTSDNLAAHWIAPDSVQIFAHGWEQADTTYLLDLETSRTSAIGERLSLFASLWMLLLLATLVLETLVLVFTTPPPTATSDPPPPDAS